MSQSLADRIAEDLRAQIAKGTLPPESKLPTYAELGEKYGADKNTAGRAVGLLRDQNWVYSIQGKGTFVLDPASRTEAPSDAKLLTLITTQLESIQSELHGLQERVNRLESQVK